MLDIYLVSNPFLLIPGILQKGNGDWLEFHSFPRLSTLTMGTGIKRPVQCGQACKTVQKAKDAELLNVVGMAMGPDGAIYVGDFNLIRKISPGGEVQTLLQFG